MIEQTSRLPAPAVAVWARAVTPAGINDELRPILKMTMPKGVEGKTIADVEVGAELGRSWILLGGVLPVDYDDLRLTEVEAGPGIFRFQERSRTSTFAVWTHERIVEPAGEGACRITDRLGWELRPFVARIPGSGRIAGVVVGYLFRHRHRRLARYWSG